MATAIGIAGSTRRGSFNGALLRAAAELAPPDLTIEVVTIRDIPLYDGDLEEQGIPQPVAALKDRVAAADALLLVSPEYNNSLPGVLKNAIDWMTRPASDIPRVFGDKPVGLIGATIGPGGTRLAQAAWLPVFRLLNMRPFFAKSLFTAGANKVFDASGRLTDDKIREVLTGYLAGFARFITGPRS